MGNRPIFAGAPTIEVDLAEWEKMQRLAGRVISATDYLRYCENDRGYMTTDDARIIRLILGCNSSNHSKKVINETESEPNETEGKEEGTE